MLHDQGVNGQEAAHDQGVNRQEVLYDQGVNWQHGQALNCRHCGSEMDMHITYGPGVAMTVQAICPVCKASGPEMKVDEEKARSLIREGVRERRRRRIGQRSMGPRMRKRYILEAMARPSVWMVEDTNTK